MLIHGKSVCSASVQMDERRDFFESDNGFCASVSPDCADAMSTPCSTEMSDADFFLKIRKNERARDGRDSVASSVDDKTGAFKRNILDNELLLGRG